MVVDKRREAMRQALLTKTQHSYETRADSGQFRSIFKDGTGAVIWKCIGGDHMVDIIPYKAGRFDPDKNLKPGDYTYVLIAWVHYGIGVNQDAFICPAKNYNKPCPICEDREKLRKEENFDEDLIKSLTPKKRSIYNIVVYDNEKEQAKGVQIWDVAHWFMERLITPLAKAPSRGSKTVPFIPFTDPDEGKSISFERQGTGADNTSFIGHKFVDREYIIEEVILAQAKCLDELIIQTPYDELRAAYFGEVVEEEEVIEEEIASEPDVEVEEVPRSEPLRKLTPPGKSPARKPQIQTGCPAGGAFGIDWEQLEACGGCAQWNACSAEADKLEVDNQAVEEKAKPPTRPLPPRQAAKPTNPPPSGRPILRPRTK